MPRRQRIVTCRRPRLGRGAGRGVAGRVSFDRPQGTDHMTSNVGSGPALARRRRAPAARGHPGNHGLETIEGTNQTIGNHTSQSVFWQARGTRRSLPGEICHGQQAS
jgi:hypothetical protein